MISQVLKGFVKNSKLQIQIFFFEKGANHGLGHIYAYGIKVPDSVNKWPGYKFSDEGGAASCGCLIDKIKAEDIKQSSILLKVN